MAAKGQAGALIIAAVLCSGAAQAKCSASDLQWMVGNWSTKNDGILRERWQLGPAGELIGFAWGPNHIHPGDVIEVSAIAVEGDRLVLRERHFDGRLAGASEGIDDPITSSATSCKRGAVEFDGIGKWAGGRVTYSRDGDMLLVDGIAHDNGRAGHFHIVLKRE